MTLKKENKNDRDLYAILMLPHVSAWHTVSVPAHSGASRKTEQVLTVTNHPLDNL